MNYSCNKGGEKEDEDEEEERAEEDQGELLFTKAVIIENFSCAGSIIGAFMAQILTVSNV